MSTVRSFIVRVYGRRGGHALRGTLEPVPQAPAQGRQPPQAFANEAELLGLMHGGRAPVHDDGPPPAPPRPARG